jgi:2-dehydro-3-deoxyphosphogluconate aldolase/(4S)-4-hydroxy-2-oxoglutarate aldolase
VVVLDDAAAAPAVARALCQGGLPCAEVTFRTPAAAEAISLIARDVPEVLLGAGTVLTIEQAKQALEAGAVFIVAPGLNPRVVEYCVERNVPVLPGVATPTEVEAALAMGVQVMKFFPAEASGGVEYLKAMGAPYGSVRFIPTGGVSPANLLTYLKAPRVIACGGSWMVGSDLIGAKRFDEIQRLTAEAMRLMLGFELRHVGINGTSEDEAKGRAESIATMLQFPVKPGGSSIFVGTSFELTKAKFPGEHGHLAIGTPFIRRARAYLERRGYTVRPATASEKEGKLISIYLEQEIGGFAMHLLQT